MPLFSKEIEQKHNVCFSSSLPGEVLLITGGVTGGFADRGYPAILGAEMPKSIIIFADCGYWLHFCGMQIFLQI